MAHCPVVAVEGIIGAGKSTLCGKLAQRLNLFELPEPTETNPYLDKFYADKARWALQMQMWLVTRRCRDMLLAKDDLGLRRGILLDRSILGDRVFADMLRKDGLISDDLWPVYEDFFDTMTTLVPPPNVIVYMDVKPDQAMGYVAKRGRKSETNGVTLAYQQQLKAGYDRMIDRVVNSAEPWAGKSTVIKIVGYLSDEGVDRIADQIAAAIQHI